MAKAPTVAQRKRWDAVCQLGCMVCGDYPEIHHCGTGGGGRKNHDLVIGLCYLHHRGAHGIHFMGRKKWQAIYGSEKELLDKLGGLMQPFLQ